MRARRADTTHMCSLLPNSALSTRPLDRVPRGFELGLRVHLYNTALSAAQAEWGPVVLVYQSFAGQGSHPD